MAKKGKSIRPRGQNPVIAVRVPKPLYERIKASAKEAGLTMSEQMAALLARGFEWQDAFGEVKQLLAHSRAIAEGNLKAELRRRGWKPKHGSPYWIEPKAAPKDGFVTDEMDRET